MFDKNKITFKVDALKVLQRVKNKYEVQERAAILKNWAIEDQDYEQAVLFRDIERSPEKFPIGELTNPIKWVE
jgi:hypothetical protein